MPKHWLPLEANPEILTAYAHRLGLSEKYAFHDVLSVEPWALELVPTPVVAILLLFPISEASEAERVSTRSDQEATLYFMKQHIGNACGTIGVLHTLTNLHRVEGFQDLPPSDSYIGRLITQTNTMNPDERGRWLEVDEEIERAHVACGDLGQSEAQDEEVDTHFVAFVNDGGKIYELDGRREGPILRGVIDTPEDFALRVLDTIRTNFMERNPEDIRFSILALAPTPSD
jgi:ubiquitin carboxyl-terminal hydrolase L3